MNRCQRLVRSLSEDEKKKVLLRKFSTLERKLYRIYLHEERDLSNATLAGRLAMHEVHISRTNTELLFKVASIYQPNEIESYLRLFLKARLFQTLLTEILVVEKDIHRLKSNDKRIHVYNTLISIASEIPYSTDSVRLLYRLASLSKASNTIFPKGHIESYELIALGFEIFYRVTCHVQQNETVKFQKVVESKLKHYHSTMEICNNSLLNDRYFATKWAYHMYIKHDLRAAQDVLRNELDTTKALRSYQYQFDPFCIFGSEKRYITILFLLDKDSELISYISNLPPNDKEKLFMFYKNQSLASFYSYSLIITNHFTQAQEFSQWYSSRIKSSQDVDTRIRIRALLIEAQSHIITSDHKNACQAIIDASQLNKGKDYSRGAEVEIRKLESFIYVLLGNVDIAEIVLDRNIKWFVRNITSIQKTELFFLRLIDPVVEFHRTKKKSSIKKWSRALRKYHESVSNREMNLVFIKIIADKYDLPISPLQ